MDQGAPGEGSVSFTADVLAGALRDPAASSPAAVLARWLPLARPATLPLAVAPALAGLALLWAQGERIHITAAVSLVAAALLVLAGATMLNEYRDYARFAPLRGGLVLRGPEPPATLLDDAGIPPQQVQRVSLALLAAGAAVGVPAALSGGWGTALLGLAGVAAAALYAATPVALKLLAAGEVVVALALGPGLVIATLLSQRHGVGGGDLLLGGAFGCYALALIEATHLRDAEDDRRTRRRTLALLLGERGGRVLCAACFAAAYVLVVLAALQPRFYHGAIAALLSLPAGVIPLTGALRAEPREARALVVRQAFRAYLAFAIWLLVGFLIAGAAARLWLPITHELFG